MKITEKQKLNITKYNTDKFGVSDKWLSHNYGDFYDKLFEGKEFLSLNILEIGIYFGGSVRLFHDYLMNSNIVGLDINNIWSYGNIAGSERFQAYFFDAYNIENWKILPIQKYDIIVDDGPHTYESQLYCLNNFTNFLTNGGKLVLEDVPIDYLNTLIDQSSCDKSKITIFNWSDNSILKDDNIILYTNI